MYGNLISSQVFRYKAYDKIQILWRWKLHKSLLNVFIFVLSKMTYWLKKRIGKQTLFAMFSDNPKLLLFYKVYNDIFLWWNSAFWNFSDFRQKENFSLSKNSWNKVFDRSFVAAEVLAFFSKFYRTIEFLS